jgi:octaprenyl-diphosphate synthase
LLHDDVVDESDQRRGKASANALFGNEAAVLVGDFLFSRSFQLMVEDGSLDVLRVLSNASAVIAEGEVLQLSTANNLATTEEQYLKVISAKTAALFAAACETGAIAAGRGAEDCKRLKDYGFYLGMAFQISDDVLDYAADEKTLGKTLGDDFREGKMTLPVIYATQNASAEERTFWQRCLADQNQNDSDFAQALSLLKKENIFEKCLLRAKSYAGLASDALDAYPPSDLRNTLQDLAIFAADRDY